LCYSDQTPHRAYQIDAADDAEADQRDEQNNCSSLGARRGLRVRDDGWRADGLYLLSRDDAD
jgi:hypothetical protein